MKTASGNKAPNITFAVSALNEEMLIDEFVTEAHQVVKPYVGEFEFILIDDGSTDRTGAIMDSLARSLSNTTVMHNERNLGLGRSYKRALRVARYEHFMLLCGDGGLPAESLPAILEKIGAADMVLPYMTNLRELKSLRRYATSRTYTKILNFLFGLDIRYYNGLPVHKVELLRKLAIANNGFGFQAEIIIKLILAGHSFTQVGVLGGERSGGSRALRPKNIVGVAGMFISLFRQKLRNRELK